MNNDSTTKVWFLTGIDYNRHSKKMRFRTWGFYMHGLDAVRSVVCNRGNMHETSYEWLVLEQIGEGIHNYHDEVQIFFEWNHDREEWVELDQMPDIIRKELGGMNTQFALIG